MLILHTLRFLEAGNLGNPSQSLVIGKPDLSAACLDGVRWAGWSTEGVFLTIRWRIRQQSALVDGGVFWSRDESRNATVVRFVACFEAWVGR